MNDKTTRIASHITTGHLELGIGGYTYPSTWQGDTFIWCDLGYSEDDLKRATINITTAAEMEDWHDQATAWQASHPGSDLYEALRAVDGASADFDNEWADSHARQG